MELVTNKFIDVFVYNKSAWMFVRFWAYIVVVFIKNKIHLLSIIDIVEMSPWMVPRPREGILYFFWGGGVRICNAVVIVHLCS